MPIQMTEDDDSSSTNNDDSGGGGGGGRGGGGGGGGGSGGGGGGGFALIVALLTFFWRYPKLGAIALVLATGYYFCGGDSPSPSADPSAPKKSASTGKKNKASHQDNKGPGTLGTGATLDPEVYDTALVHEPLDENGNPGLPRRVSLREFAPPRGNQGHQGSCVGWSTSYAARSILYAQQTGKDPATTRFSPSFVYNPIAKPGCHGTYIIRALEAMQGVGDVPWDEFAYDQDSCSKKPSSDLKERAAEFRIRGFDRLSVDDDDYATNAAAVKQHLAQRAPVVIGMDVGGTFETEMNGTRVWHPTQADRDRDGDWGGHALAVIGYDDTLEGGAFEIMNSWGKKWGEDGVAFVRYEDFSEFVHEAYGLYPMGVAKDVADQPQHITFGLVENKKQQRIALESQGGITWRTTAALKKGTRFKVEYSNGKPTYTYIFGQQTDGSSYVLFPYNAKHDPYCGTTGTRIFPRKQSLTVDDVGTRDSIAVVISPEPLDFKALNEQITTEAGDTYAEKLTGVFGDQMISEPSVSIEDDLLSLTSEADQADKLYVMVIEVDKK